MVRRPLIGALALALVSCGGKDPDATGTTPDPTTTECADVTWETFAEGFFDTWCTGCHSVTVTGDDRNFAPEGVDFDTYADVVPYGPRIQQSVVDEPPWMPPQGGVTAGDRELLGTWIACGMPGDEPGPTGCDAAVQVAGDQVVGAADVAALCSDPAVAIGGSLTVSGDVAIDCLCSVGGVLTVTDGLDAPQLTEVGGLYLTGASSVELPELVEISGDFEAVGTSATGISLPELARVGGSVVVQGNPQLAGFGVPRLATIGGEMRFEGNDALVNLSETLAVDTVGPISVIDNDALLDLDAFRFASQVGGVVIEGNALLQEVGGVELITELTGDVRIASNPALRRLGGLDSLVDLHGSLAIRDNVQLEAIEGYVNLATVDGDLTITGNAALPQGDVDAFAGGVAVGGTTDVTGNGP